jgi:indolepyruvate ferredoxin oxidoreductase alpha subunit
MKSQIWLLDPRPNLESIVKSVEDAFELSEASNTPVMLEVRIRACHLHGRFIARDNKRPPFTVADALENPRRETQRIVLPPASYAHEHEKINVRLPAAIKVIKERQLNEVFGPVDSNVGIILQGGMYNGVVRALQQLGLADIWGNTAIPLYVLNVTYPLIDDEVVDFCRDKDAVLVVEEAQPDYIEQNLAKILRNAGVGARLVGKGPLPMAGEYTAKVLIDGVGAFLRGHAPDTLSDRLRAPNVPSADADETMAELAKEVPIRPAGFRTGCPERPIFAAMKLVQNEVGAHQVASDIGCHLFSILPPFNIGATTMGYGLGWAGASAFNTQETGKRTLSIMGDGGFWHNGLTSGVGNAVFNQSDNVLVVIDNGYSAATGGQDLPSSRAANPLRSTNNPIERAVRGVGVKWVRSVTNTYSLSQMRDTLREALTSKEKGPKVIVASSECMLNRQRREKPLVRKAIEGGRRVVRERFGIDPDTCTGDHSCIRLSGCPSLTIKPNPDPLRRDPIATVLDSCVGCGLCGEVADAAVLCPSFYRAEIINNPSRWDRVKQRVRMAVIGWLQTRIERRLEGLAA